MAYIKIFPIKVTDKKALDYIMNPDKTEEKLLISSFACSPESADAKTAPDPQKYKAAHQSEYKLHDSLKQQLQELGITKLPSPERLQKKIDNLRNERSSATKE